MRVTLNTGELSAVNRDRSKTAYVKIEDVLVLEDRKRVARYLGQIRRDQQGRPSYGRKVSQPRDKLAGTFKPVHSLGRSPKDEVRPLLVNREPRIADFQHVEIVPCSWACKSSDRNDLVDDAEQVIPGRGRADVISMKSRRTQLHKRMS